MAALNLRRAVRAIILTGDDRVLLCRHLVPGPAGSAVWAAPGGRIEDGETPLAALGRELREEVGLALEGEPPHVWHREVVAPGHMPGYDGSVSGYFLVRTEEFTPCRITSELAAEHISELRWWALPEIVGYRGSDLFGPLDLGALLTALVVQGVPLEPISVGR